MTQPDDRPAPTPGRSKRCIRALSVVLVMAGLQACADHVAAVMQSEVSQTDSATAADAPTELPMPTYDATGQTVHPDVARAPDWFPNQRWHMAITPYPNGDVTRENPSVFSSSDPWHWSLIPGEPNPVVRPKRGYLSDPDIVFNPDVHELWMYYRQVVDENVILLVRSADGVTWSPAEELIRVPNHGLVSPAVVRRASNDWQMWSVDAGPGGCSAPTTHVVRRRSTDGRSWSDPEAVDLPAPMRGLTPWHIDVQWIPSRQEYWAVFNVKQAGGCATTALFMATSPDGVTWTTRPQPILLAGDIAALSAIVYRSTFSYNANTGKVTFWFSGASVGSADNRFYWKTVAQRMKLTTLLKRTGWTAEAREVPRQTRRLHRPP